MKKIISSLASSLLIFVASFSLTSIAKSAEFFSIGTGGPTGVYFQVGNAVCKMVAKIQSADHGRKKGTDKALRCSAPSRRIYLQYRSNYGRRTTIWCSAVRLAISCI